MFVIIAEKVRSLNLEVSDFVDLRLLESSRRRDNMANEGQFLHSFEVVKCQLSRRELDVLLDEVRLEQSDHIEA